MAAFIASYAGPSGQKRTLTVKAANEAEAKVLLRRRGIRANELRPVKPGSNEDAKGEGSLGSIDLNRLFEKAPGVKEKAVFASKLAALVDAGVPIVRSLDLTATAQFCRIFRSLTRAGVPILMSMEISSETAGNAIISNAILASRGMVQEGVLLSNALIRQKVLPDMAMSGSTF